MEDFPLDRPELSGSLITLEFGSAGRIQQFWVADPALPEDGQEFQFVIPPVTFAEEFAEDYYPGTILIGARTRPDDPWILDRCKDANPTDEEEDQRIAGFEYTFSLLPDLIVTGKFHEQSQPIPQILWDLKITNTGRVSVEIGELAFPLALNNLYEGEPSPDERKPGSLADRVRIHPFIGGAASYVFAQRLNGEPPGLLVFPGDGTSWELWASAPASLHTGLRWGGIPVVYVFARAAVEREGWGEAGTSSSLILEAGDSKSFQTRFVATGAGGHDAALQNLAVCGRPAMKLLPAAVAPRDVGIAVEIGGAKPVRFAASQKSDMETDSDELGGFCFVRPKQPGPITLGFEDSLGRHSSSQLFFTEPIENLIKARAAYIVARQVCRAQGTAFDRAILPQNLRTGNLIEAPEALGNAFPIESGLSDALFLAEKNSIYPNLGEISVLEEFISEFLRDDLQNPSDGSVGAAFIDQSAVAIHYGRPQIYALTFNFYSSMAKVAKATGQTRQNHKEYLRHAYMTAMAMFRYAMVADAAIGVLCISGIEPLILQLRQSELIAEAEELSRVRISHAGEVVTATKRPAIDWIWNPAACEHHFWAAKLAGDSEALSRALSFAVPLRGLGPCWWSYGSDQRIPFEPDVVHHPAFADRGALMLGHSTVQNSLLFFQTCDRDYDRISDGPMRMSFGGMLAPWAMVRPDGAASMGYCPDPASKHHGSSVWTGDLGLALFAYLNGVSSWVFPSRTFGLFTFGCHFETDSEGYSVRPWDGVGRRITLRQIGFETSLEFGKISLLKLDVRKRWARFEIENPADFDAVASLTMRGLWGQNFEVGGKSVQSVNGELSINVELPSLGRKIVEVVAVKM